MLSRCTAWRHTLCGPVTRRISTSQVKITRIELYELTFAVRDGGLRFGKSQRFEGATSTIVKLSTNVDIHGFGETCPIGSVYLPAFAGGTKTAIEEMGPKLIGKDPTKLIQLNRCMDEALQGHNHVKSPIDVACWDILGQLSQFPVCHLLGGRYGDDYPLYAMISQDSPDKMAAKVRQLRKKGYRRFQMKTGSDTIIDIDRILACAEEVKRGDILTADANTAWTQHEAMQVLHAIQDIRSVALYVEQPCPTYEECLAIRRTFSRPIILDECLDSFHMLQRAIADQTADVISLKMSKVGGLTKAKLLRDACIVFGLPVVPEDTWTTDIGQAAVAHFAHSTPPKVFFGSSDCSSHNDPADTALYGPKPVNGRSAAPTRPGLGVKPMMELLGEPVLVID